MDYFELKFSIEPQSPFQDLLITELADIGFESFEESGSSLLAYIPENLYQEKELISLNIFTNKLVKVSYTAKKIPTQNWNALWESNYDSVCIDNRCYIRAPFHPSKSEFEFEILIEPQMSFGTAHHETTSNMISLLLKEDVSGKSFLDMGCGTSVLAILAHKKGATPVHAIDNDDWAYRNATENVVKNNANDITVELGDASLLKGQHFDIIYANINKNILLSDISTYADCLPEGGILCMSGFYADDLEDIKEAAIRQGLTYIEHLEKNNWVAVKFIKNKF